MNARHAASELGAGAIAFAVPLLVYGPFLQSTVAFWDTGESQTVPYILGIMHEPSFPAFALLGFAFTHLVAFGTVAWRMSLLSALCISVSALCTQRIIALVFAEAWIGAAAALLFPATADAALHGTRAEVHTAALMFVCLALAFGFAWRRSGRLRDAGAASLCLALALGSHPWALFAIPGVLLLLVTRAARERAGRTFAVCAASFCAGFLPYAYLPLRSAELTRDRVDPTLSLGLPPGMAFWDFGHPSSWDGFIFDVTARGYSSAVSGGFGTMFAPARIGPIALDFARYVQSETSSYVALGAVAGALVLLRAQPLCAVALLSTLLGVPFAFSYRPEADWERYLLLALWTVSLLCGLALAALAAMLRRHVPARAALVPSVALAAALLLQTQRVWLRAPDLARIDADPTAAHYVDRVIAESPADAVVVASWVHATPLAYAAYVERRLGRRIVVNSEPPDMFERSLVWARTRCVLVASDRGDLRLPDGDAPAALVPVEKVAGLLFLYRVRLAGPDRCARATS